MMEHLRPTEYQKNEMLEKAFSGTAKKTKRPFRLKYCIIAAAAVIVFSGTTVFADEIKAVFYNLLGKNELVSEDVLNEVFSDDDGHVKITVKELLSDSVNSYAIVEYTALDEIGKKWVDKDLVIGSDEDSLIRPIHYPPINYPWLEPNGYISHSLRVDELKEYHTENSRLLKLTCNMSDKTYDSIKLIYTIGEKWRNEVVLDVSESVKFKDIKIDNSLAPKKWYEPTGYKISPLGLLVYGNDLGMVEKETLPSGGYTVKLVNPEEANEEMNSMTLNMVKKDGKKYSLVSCDDSVSPDNDITVSGWTSFCSDGPGEMTIYSTAFKEPIDLELIDGIELDGIFYPIEGNEK